MFSIDISSLLFNDCHLLRLLMGKWYSAPKKRGKMMGDEKIQFINLALPMNWEKIAIINFNSWTYLLLAQNWFPKEHVGESLFQTTLLSSLLILYIAGSVAEPCFSNFKVHKNTWASCQEYTSDLVILGRVLGFHMYNKLLGDANAVGLWTTLWVAKVYRDRTGVHKASQLRKKVLESKRPVFKS